MNRLCLILFAALLVVSLAYDQECLSTSQDFVSFCSIRIDCPKHKSTNSTHLRLQHLSDYECCKRPKPRGDVFFIAFLRFGFDIGLQNSVNFDAFFSSYPTACVEKKKNFQLTYFALTGVDKSFSVCNLGSHLSRLSLRYIHLRLLDENGRKANCSADLNVSALNSSVTFELLFDVGIKYDQDTCDQIFNNANLKFLQLSDIDDSLIKRNRFAVQESQAVRKLNSRIEKLTLEGYRVSLDRKSFPWKVFGTTKSILIEGVIQTFEKDILVSRGLDQILIRSTGLRRFLHNNVDWLDKANERSTNETLYIVLDGAKRKPWHYILWYTQTQINRGNVQYETLYQLDRDDDLFDSNSSFCLFYRVKQKQLNVFLYGLLFERQSQRSCGCVLFWLLQTFPQYPAYYSSFGECSLRQEQIKQECDFDSMGARCEIQTIEPIRQENGYAFVWRVKMAEFAISTVLGPLVSCLAAILNLLVLVVFRRMRSSPEFRKKKLTDKNLPLWDYIYFNTFFVLCQALILAVEPLTACIEYDGIYCSPLILTRFAHGFYLFVQSYLGNSLKLMANMTNSLFVLYRYGINSDRLKDMRRVRPIKFVLFSLPFVLSLSAILLFDNQRFDLVIFSRDQFYYLIRDKFFKHLPSTAVNSIYLINMVLGDVVFTLFNVTVDLRLLFFLRSFESSRRKEEVESRVTKMIVLNGLFSFLFRTPEITISLSYIAFTFNPMIFPSCKLSYDSMHSVCPSLFNISRLFYTFSFFENFVLLYLFNPEFRNHVK
nr:G protein-coupled receptor [Proales similis]